MTSLQGSTVFLITCGIILAFTIKKLWDLYIEAFDLGEKSATSRWIKCSEQLPTEEDGEAYNLYEPDGVHKIVRVLACYRTDDEPVTISNFNLTTHSFRNPDSVIAWQPLPKCYEESDNDEE